MGVESPRAMESHRATVKRCEAFAQHGTGYGTCDSPLDSHGNCPNAGNHRDSAVTSRTEGA